jgi:hypothetical protein
MTPSEIVVTSPIFKKTIDFLLDLLQGLSGNILGGAPRLPITALRKLIEKRLGPLRDVEPVAGISQKLDKAVAAMQEASTFIADLNAAVDVQRRNLDKIKLDYEHYQTLAATEKAKADAVVAEMAKLVERSARKERTWGLLIGLVAHFIAVFILGVLASDWVRELWVRVFSR